MNILNDIRNSGELAEKVTLGEMGKSLAHDAIDVSPYDVEDEEYSEEEIAWELYSKDGKFYLLTRGTSSDEGTKVAELSSKPSVDEIESYVKNL